MGFWKKLFAAWFGAPSRGPELTPVFTATRPPRPPGFIPQPIPANPPPYRVFTRDFDRIVTSNELGEVLGPGYRLERAVVTRPDQGRNGVKPAWVEDLQRKAAQALDRLQKRYRPPALRDTTVSILVNLSGYMYGHPIQMVAVAVDTALDLLLKLGITVEVLGFTTATWHGGESRKTWLEVGRPPWPGRLCDLLHIVYHSADSFGTWDMRDMLYSELLKGSVDGEALEWAAGRLRALPQRRKILIVLSDGLQWDDSTYAANDVGILDRHRSNVIYTIETSGDIHLAALGVGRDVSFDYSRAQNVLIDETAPGLIDLLIDVMESALAGVSHLSLVPNENPATSPE